MLVVVPGARGRPRASAWWWQRGGWARLVVGPCLCPGLQRAAGGASARALPVCGSAQHWRGLVSLVMRCPATPDPAGAHASWRWMVAVIPRGGALSLNSGVVQFGWRAVMLRVNALCQLRPAPAAAMPCGIVE